MNFQDLVLEFEKPVVFGPKHLIGSLLVAILIAILLIYFLKVKKNTNHKNVLKGTAIFLILLELSKYTFTFMNDGRLPSNYIPMQLCSFSLYLMPMVAFGKEKLSKFIMPIAYSIGVLAGLIVLIYPSTVLGGEYSWIPIGKSIIPMISFLYHGTMIFFSLYLVMSKLYKPSFTDYKRVFLALLVFACFGALTNLVFDTDMMFLNTGSGSPLQFILLGYGRLAYMAAMILLALFLLTIPLLPYASTLKDVYEQRKNVRKVSSTR